MILFISHNNVDDDFVNNITSVFEDVPLRKTMYIDNTAQVREIKNKYELIKFKSVFANDHMKVSWLLPGSRSYVDNLKVDSFDLLSKLN